MKYIKGIAAGAAFGAVFALQAGAAFAAGNVIWTSPPDHSTFQVGTIVNPMGTASGTGTPGIGLDLMFVLDESGSMCCTLYGGKTKQQLQKDAANALVASLPSPGTSVGVVQFTSSASLAIGLTPTPSAAVTAAINSTNAGGGTNIAAGIEAATAEMQANGTAGRSKQMVVISDGQTFPDPAPAAAAAKAAGITVQSVAIPGADVATMQAIATAGGGTFTNFTNPNDLANLISIFDGTGGNLVGLDRIDITLPDSTVLSDYATDGLGNFKLPNWAMVLGDNVFKVDAFFTDQSSASATLTLKGVDTNVIPLPAAAWLLLSGIAGLGAASRMRRRA